MTHEDVALADIKAKVKELLLQFADDSDRYVDKLVQCGIVDEHNVESYQVPKKVVCAIAHTLASVYAPRLPSDLQDINNYRDFL